MSDLNGSDELIGHCWSNGLSKAVNPGYAHYFLINPLSSFCSFEQSPGVTSFLPIRCTISTSRDKWLKVLWDWMHETTLSHINYCISSKTELIKTFPHRCPNWKGFKSTQKISYDSIISTRTIKHRRSYLQIYFFPTLQLQPSLAFSLNVLICTVYALEDVLTKLYYLSEIPLRHLMP